MTTMTTERNRGWNRVGLLALFAILLPAAASAQPRSIDLVPRGDLHFGSIIASPAGGTVTVTPDGLRTTAGVFGVGGIGYSAGVFDVSVQGTGNSHYQIVLPASITLSSGGSSMIVDSFQSNPAVEGHAQPPARLETLRVGATLRVGPNQPGGNYSGSYFVTVHLMN
ncbi:MAG: DUF4402 domain-containing protein [Acidobacteria bacterium]|nr:DUF4402 domain-containing protein [Acidobacteriota bacterium]